MVVTVDSLMYLHVYFSECGFLFIDVCITDSHRKWLHGCTLPITIMVMHPGSNSPLMSNSTDSCKALLLLLPCSSPADEIWVDPFVGMSKATEVIE